MASCADGASAQGLFYCALVATDFEHGVLLAVNHGGDSDSTGSIAGNLLGVVHGWRSIPERWRKELELRREIVNFADHLWEHFEERGECDDADAYPPT